MHRSSSCIARVAPIVPGTTTVSTPTQGFEQTGSAHLIAAHGEMADRTREFPWDQTPVGPPHAWPRSLHTVLNLMLCSQHPMFLWWGPELIQFYNDGYRPSLGDDRHPQALGARGRAFWAEIWPAIGPQIEAVMGQGASTWNIDHLVPIARNHRVEEVYWTYGYSPVFDDAGRVGGTLVIVQETTGRVINERRTAILQVLTDRANAEPQTAQDVCRVAVDILREYNADVAFAVLYLLDDDGRTLRCTASTGLLPEIMQPETVDLADAAAGTATWPFRRVTASRRAAQVPDLAARFGVVPGGRWPEPATSALVLPILAPGQEQAAGVLVAGLTPRLPFDESYRDFLRSVAGQIGNAIANVQIHQREHAAREQLERLFEQAPAAIALLNGPDHVFTLADPRYLDLVGQRDVQGKSVRDALPELEGQGIFELLQHVYADGEPFVGDAVPLHLDLRGDGTLET